MRFLVLSFKESEHGAGWIVGLRMILVLCVAAAGANLISKTNITVSNSSAAERCALRWLFPTGEVGKTRTTTIACDIGGVKVLDDDEGRSWDFLY